MVGDIKYESIERDQDIIGILKLLKGVMSRFDERKVTHPCDVGILHVSVAMQAKYI